MNRPTLTIELAPLARNLAWLAAQGRSLLPVVKADAYGLGIAAFLPALLQAALQAEQTLDALCIATIDEGLELRDLGWEKDILLLGSCHENAFADLNDQQIIPLLDHPHLIDAWIKLNQKHCAIMVDTGMSRRGLPADTLEPILATLPDHCRVELATHHACADIAGSPIPAQQQQCWQHTVSRSVVHPLRVHSANSAAILNGHAAACDTHTRPGLSLYGVQPQATAGSIEPVFVLQSPLAEIRHVTSGAGISYGHEYVAQHDMTLGLLPCGYADGLPVRSGTKIDFRIATHTLPVVGRITMDMTLVDLSNIPTSCYTEPVTIMGLPGQQVRDWSQAAGCSRYEILTGLGRRWQRVIAP